MDDKGKERAIPHPVAELRRYDAASESYVALDPTLDGAPTGGSPESQELWTSLLADLKQLTAEQVGADFVDDCLAMDLGELKAKYI